MKTLRPHQEKAIKALFDYFHKTAGNPLVVAPVGAGKSLLIAEFVRQAIEKYPDTRFLVVTHVKELLRQNADELHEQCPNVNYTFFCAGLKEKDLTGQVVFASVQSIEKHAFKFPQPPDIVFVDEAHLIPHNEDTRYQNLIAKLEMANPSVKIIGMTGTPFRENGKSIVDFDGAIFDDIVFQIPMLYLIEKGFLSPVVAPPVKTRMSVDGVQVRNGDYVESQLQRAVDKDDITKSCIDEIIEHGKDRKQWLIFTAGVAHCQHVRDAIRARGIFCEMVHGATPKDERDAIIKRYKAGDIKCLVNVAVLTTGFNSPAIDLIAFMRPTRSPVLYVQTLGRGMRTSPGKTDCLLLDFGGVVDTLGPVDTIDARFLKTQSSSEKVGDAPIKVCPVCNAVCFAGVSECMDCGYVFPPKEVKINSSAARGAAVLSNQLPTDEYKVLGVKYARHEKEGKPPSMKVTYTTMGGSFSEWICFEHTGYAKTKALIWHGKRLAGIPAPETVRDALLCFYPPPSHISVRRNGKYFEIVGYRFDEYGIKPEEMPQGSASQEIDLGDFPDIAF